MPSAQRQRAVSTRRQREAMNTEASVLVAAAVVNADAGDTELARELLDHAKPQAVTTRDRQLVEIAAAHLAGNQDRFDALVRDHLSEYPDNQLANWMAGTQEQSQAHEGANNE